MDRQLDWSMDGRNLSCSPVRDSSSTNACGSVRKEPRGNSRQYFPPHIKKRTRNASPRLVKPDEADRSHCSSRDWEGSRRSPRRKEDRRDSLSSHSRYSSSSRRSASGDYISERSSSKTPSLVYEKNKRHKTVQSSKDRNQSRSPEMDNSNTNASWRERNSLRDNSMERSQLHKKKRAGTVTSQPEVILRPVKLENRDRPHSPNGVKKDRYHSTRRREDKRNSSSNHNHRASSPRRSHGRTRSRMENSESKHRRPSAPDNTIKQEFESVVITLHGKERKSNEAEFEPRRGGALPKRS